MIESLIAAVLLHPMHETYAEIEWNPQTGRTEVAMMLDVLDEEWIARRYRRDESDDSWRLDYLKRRFRLDGRPPAQADANAGNEDTPPATGTPTEATGPDAETTYRWVGRGQDRGHVWWFFEVELPEQAQPRTIRNEVLFDRDRRFRHRVTLLHSQPKRTLVLDTRQPAAALPGRWGRVE